MERLDHKLAELLPNYPAIWKRGCNDFKNKVKKENSFKAIAKELKTTVEVVIGGYKYLRERFRKENEKIEKETRSGAGLSEEIVWPLYESLRFLSSVILKRKTETNLALPTDTLNEDLSEFQFETLMELNDDNSKMSIIMDTEKDEEINDIIYIVEEKTAKECASENIESTKLPQINNLEKSASKDMHQKL
ncbi:unnamed protein product [Ceutorhynchus assimilis]|uniref:MADF domain-containing protein n=1 Tax=Ceutorhynchus assimilis TaxID=467358 RepID=A0A9N9QQG3_9CUCU|nr:unnamed protein product [Ceutorhynchus assimilis]